MSAIWARNLNGYDKVVEWISKKENIDKNRIKKVGLSTKGGLLYIRDKNSSYYIGEKNLPAECLRIMAMGLSKEHPNSSSIPYLNNLYTIKISQPTIEQVVKNTFQEWDTFSVDIHPTTIRGKNVLDIVISGKNTGYTESLLAVDPEENTDQIVTEIKAKLDSRKERIISNLKKKLADKQMQNYRNDYASKLIEALNDKLKNRQYSIVSIDTRVIRIQSGSLAFSIATSAPFKIYNSCIDAAISLSPVDFQLVNSRYRCTIHDLCTKDINKGVKQILSCINNLEPIKLQLKGLNSLSREYLKKLCSRFYEENELLNKYPELWLSGANVSDPEYSFDPKDGSIVISNNYASTRFTANSTNVRTTYTNEYKKLKKQSSSAKYISCYEFACSLAKEYQLSIISLNRKGALLDEAKLQFKRNAACIEIPFDSPTYKKSSKWKKEIEKIFKDANAKLVEIQKHIDEENQNRALQKVGAYLGNYLAYDIWDFVRIHQKYITAKAVAQALRGVQVSLNTDIFKIPCIGRYNMLDECTITNLINRMAKVGILTTTYHDGKYCEFYTLNVSDLPGIEVWNESYNPNHMSTLEKYKSGLWLTDAEANVVFQSLKDSKNPADKMKILDLLKYSGFTCMHFDEIADVYRNEPAFADLFSMKADMESKEFLKKVYKRLKKEVKKKD